MTATGTLQVHLYNTEMENGFCGPREALQIPIAESATQGHDVKNILEAGKGVSCKVYTCTASRNLPFFSYDVTPVVVLQRTCVSIGPLGQVRGD